MRTVYGRLADPLGHASTEILVQGPTRPELRRKAWATPAGEVRKKQAPFIGIDRHHDGRWIGEIISLQLRHGNLWAVGLVDDDVTDTIPVKVGTELRHVQAPMFWSASRLATEDWRDIIVDSVSVTPFPARVSPGRPLAFRDGEPHMVIFKSSDPFEKELLRQAELDQRDRRARRPILVHDIGATSSIEDTAPFEFVSPGQIEYRSASFDVAPGRREIVALCAPYEREAHGVVIRGKRCREVFSVGAFDAVAAQSNTVRLNLNHRAEDVVGKAVEFITGRTEGLIATFRVSRTRLGNEALEMAATDLVDLSVGFGALRETWPHHDLRRVHEAYLDHCALTSAPAYSTKVLAVRGDELAGVR